MKIVFFVLSIIITEILLGCLFYAITPKAIRPSKGLDYRSLVKGVIERFFLTFSLVNGLPHVLALFGALKLATRLKREKEKEDLYNDFYLVGNFISVIVAIFYMIIYNKYI
jgi:hypothetical protein